MSLNNKKGMEKKEFSHAYIGTHIIFSINYFFIVGYFFYIFFTFTCSSTFQIFLPSAQHF